MVLRYKYFDIYHNYFVPFVFSPLFHKNTPVSFITLETGTLGKFFAFKAFGNFLRKL